MLLAYFAFSAIDTGAKWLALFGLPVFQLVFMRYAGHFVISAALIARGGVSRRRFSTDKALWVVVRGLLLLSSTLFNFLAVRALPLTLTATIFFTTPIIVCALSGPLLGERVGIWRWSAIVVGFAGVLVVVRPFGDAVSPAVLYSIAAVTSFALYAILTRKLVGAIASDTLQVYSSAVGVVAAAPLAAWQWQTPAGVAEWLVMVSLGVSGWAGHELLTRAHAFAPASTLTPFVYSLMLYMTFWSFVVFAQLPDAWTLAGAAIVVASGLVIWFRERRLGVRQAAADAITR